MKKDNYSAESKPRLTPAQRQKMKKYAVFAVLGLLFVVCMWLIFKPSSNTKTKGRLTRGFNSEVPMPKEKGIVEDKESAYEDERNQQKKEEKIRSLQDFAALLGENDKRGLSGDETSGNEESYSNESGNANGYSGGSRSSSIQNSVSAYRNVNRTLGTFYDTPKQDSEKERLVEELEELKAKLAEKENRKENVDDQAALMEKSYQMAAKYMPQLQGQSAGNDQTSKNIQQKIPVVRVSRVKSQTVSSLEQHSTGVSHPKTSNVPRNTGFLTPTSSSAEEPKNTISACIHTAQTVMDGQSIQLRLLEQMQAGTMIIPCNTVLSGIVKIEGERMDITVSSLESAGMILPVSLSVYDADGQRGIFIPNTTEATAAKEMMANMGTSTGTSINLAGNASQQLAADMGRSLIQGASQLVSKKLREVKINLKAGYRVYLMANDKQNSNQ